MATTDTKEEYGISPVALDALERDFVEVMKELSAEDNLERFRLEYDKLHRALKKSHESEKRLIKKCHELQQDITVNAGKVQTALRLIQDDENTVDSLRKEIEKAWKMVDSAHEKESRAKDTIQLLKKEVNRLTSLVEHGAGLTLGQETSLNDLIEEKRAYTKERDSLAQKVTQQTIELKELVENVSKTEQELSQKSQLASQKTEAYQKLVKEHDLEMRKRENTEKSVTDLHKAIEKRSRDLDVLKENLRRKTEQVETMERDLKAERERIHDLQIKVDRSEAETVQVKATFTQIVAQNEEYQKSIIPGLQTQLDHKERFVVQARKKHSKLLTAIAAQDQEHERLQREKAVAHNHTGTLTSRINDLTARLEAVQRDEEALERRLKDEVRDKNLNVSKAERQETLRNTLDSDRSIEMSKNRSLEQEVESHRVECQRISKKMADLEEQRRKYKQNADEATRRYYGALEQVKLAKRRITERQAELAESEKRLKTQNAMYEQVLSDRNLYSKKHNEARGDIEEMDKQFKVIDQEINQLKDTLRKREMDLCVEHTQHTQAQQLFQSSRDEEEKKAAAVKEAKARANELADEIKNLTQIIADSDTERSKQQMKFNAVTNERNILATQLIRRNEELSLLYEKIRIQQSTLVKGESQYRERLIDISMLRKKVHELRTQLKTSLARIRYIEEMRRQITTLQRALIRERTKVKALFEELQNPMNVHRWRKLEGSDPAEYENILKLHTLQKRLIAKIEESRQKDLVIQEKERHYRDLKAVLARQPGPEIAEQLTAYHDSIAQRTVQLKKMSDELDLSRSQVNELKGDIDRLTGELQEVRKDFLSLKSKNTLLVRERTLASATHAGRVNAGDAEFVVHQPPPSQPRYAGGGFCLSSAPS